jgi:hypothetical protein
MAVSYFNSSWLKRFKLEYYGNSNSKLRASYSIAVEALMISSLLRLNRSFVNET